MLVTFRDVRHAFADLESGKRGRGEIAQWAFGATRAKGAGLLIEPPASADVVWRGLVYLSEADVRSDSGLCFTRSRMSSGSVVNSASSVPIMRLRWAG